MVALELTHCSEAEARQGRNTEIPVAGMFECGNGNCATRHESHSGSALHKTTCNYRNARYDEEGPVGGAWTAGECTVNRGMDGGANGVLNFDFRQADPAPVPGFGDGLPQNLDPWYTWAWYGGACAAHEEVREETECMDNTPGLHLGNFEVGALCHNQYWTADWPQNHGTVSASSSMGWNDQRIQHMPCAVTWAPPPYPCQWEQTGADPC